VLGESAGTGRLVFVNGYCRSASASICAITSRWLIRIHSMAAALMKLERLILCSRGELLSVFVSVGFMALSGGGHVSHEHELGGEHYRRRIPA
jgi:hypothetical protein